MDCPNCGGHMGLEDATCPYCGTPNAMAAQHQSDMARYRRDYQRTKADVMAKTSLMQSHGSWLIILAVLLAALTAGIILNIYAWDIGYDIRSSNAERGFDEDAQALDAYLDQGDYGKFVGYYDANDLSLSYDQPYQALKTAASSYVNILRYISAIDNPSSHLFKPEYISNTCEYLAEDLNRIYTLEQNYSYHTERYLPPDKQKYVDDIRERTAVISKAYFGLTDEDIQDIPDMSVKKLGTLIEKGIAS